MFLEGMFEEVIGQTGARFLDMYLVEYFCTKVHKKYDIWLRSFQIQPL